MISVEKPGSPSEILEHFGTKGMKWGVRRTQGSKDFAKNFPTGKQRAAEIRRARESVSKSKEAVGRAKNLEDRKRLADINLKNPDRATALRMTRGEKIVTGLLYTLTPTVVVPAALAVTTAALVGKRRAIEK